MGKSFDITLVANFLPKLLYYLPLTLLILAASLALGLILGTLIAITRLYRIPVLNEISIVYVSFIRGTPILIQLFLVFYGLPLLLEIVHINISRWDPIYFVIITYGLSIAAFKSENIRAAVNAVDRGQTEAAYAVGMTGTQSFARIIAPQALLIAFPNFANSVIGFLKDTSLAFSIGVMDMMGRGQTLIAATAHTLEVYISLTIIYYATVLIFEKVFRVTEFRLQRHERPLTG
ncbi:L-cystine transport system permease protein TcyL [Paenibacillus marchantiophytorum]|uniref:L-cystine transport system permease protein TcyL n=1 Tax=Paenibacillus marchantiophytorum TaxID=1619310 RepID=A0ABQ2BR03_9BACL|nr:amino acid ABC transporter permease [Paenibacillus marchantiophytorum]GGI43716.1 L-cystine transport system permease protein TcyL [Paenibacillus marchantiophytorum]